MSAFLQEINVKKSDDIITVLIRQRYKPRGGSTVAYRWRIAGQYSLKQLEKEESMQRNSGRRKNNVMR